MIVITDKELRPRAVKTVAEVTHPVWTGAAAGSKLQRLPCLALYCQLGVGVPSLPLSSSLAGCPAETESGLSSWRPRRALT